MGTDRAVPLVVFKKENVKMSNSNHIGNTSARYIRSVIYWEELLKNRKSETSMSDLMETRRASNCS